ncbi:hydroxypyruvate isomerase [Polynucleobacter sp. IMCC30063]|uniref:hydroxypyruvate isomerase n=1 Tax=Polynucleobacter sp. IMCC30063 TaxID=2907298 RepID=UPI001F1AFAB6|nr:hydroxypyruvate isomerase [Polynucleobacter sp. IMCC30063]MCE7506882.1 hydroxypyruvate isomerase [Polynucleobacter sp. IMCC30063]
MPQFAANLSLLFNEVPFLERFEKASQTGFKAVEFLFPYAYAAEEIKTRLDQYHLKIVLHNLPPGNIETNERGIACLPNRIEEFRLGVATGIQYAKILGVQQLNCLAGIAPNDIDAKLLRQTLITNLQYAAKEFHAAGLKLLIEPINTFDIPNFFLSRTEQAIAILDEVAAPNAFLQFDIYHAQRMAGELAKTIELYLPRIAHMQLADNPGRNEPGTGEINYYFLFELIDRLQYSGWIGCEYKPLTSTEAGLSWMKRLKNDLTQ